MGTPAACGATLTAAEPQLLRVAIQLDRGRVDDLVQDGCVGVLVTMGRYRAGGATFAVAQARCARLDGRCRDRVQRPNTMKRYNRATRELGRPPEPADVAAGITWSARCCLGGRVGSAIEAALRSGHAGTDDPRGEGDVFVDRTTPSPLAAVIAIDERRRVTLANKRSVGQIRDRKIFRRRFWLEPYTTPETYAAIALKLKLTRQRVQQLLVRSCRAIAVALVTLPARRRRGA